MVRALQGTNSSANVVTHLHIMGSEKATIQEESPFITTAMIVGGLSFLLILAIASAVMLFLQLQNLREDAMFEEGAPDAELES